jgi:hypothetical protein
MRRRINFDVTVDSTGSILAGTTYIPIETKFTTFNLISVVLVKGIFSVSALLILKEGKATIATSITVHGD